MPFSEAELAYFKSQRLGWSLPYAVTMFDRDPAKNKSQPPEEGARMAVSSWRMLRVFIRLLKHFWASLLNRQSGRKKVELHCRYFHLNSLPRR
jgi:hypothetical protein